MKVKKRESLNLKSFKFLKTWVLPMSQWKKCKKEKKNNLNKDRF